MKYLAIDILKLAGVEAPEEKIGKVSVRIGGVVANEPNKIINLMDKEIEVIVARTEKFVAHIPEVQDEAHAAGVKAEQERQGKIASQPHLDREAAKAEATPATPSE